MKYITLYIFTILFFTNALAQNIDSSMTIDDLKLESDSIGFNELDVDDMLNSVFSEKMDSMMSSWDIQNRFNFDNSEVTTLDFPKNLPDSVYINRLKEIEQVVDLSYNKVVKNYIKMYTERRRDLVEVMLGLSAYYFPIFEETLDKYDMPLEIKYLAIIESALNPTARSRVGANGLWQFMYGTARSMKLEITSFVDERRDPVKATDAAARYLSKLHDIYGNWHLAIAAYNCGPGNVNRAIRRSGGKRNYWEIYYRLPRETRGYVPAFIAATYAFEYHKEHNLVPRFPEIELSVDTVMVNDYLHFDQISAKIHIEKEQLRALNPMYRRDVIPAKKSKSYPLVLPNNVILDFVDLDTAIFAFERDKYFPENTLMDPTTSNSSYFTPVDIKGKAKVVYTVKAGDNVGFISSWFKVRASDLRYWNNIRRDMIRVGQKLAIYVPEKDKEKYEKVTNMTFSQKQASIGKSSAPTKTLETKPLDSNYEYYTVRKGDTLWDIAQKYVGISADEIMRLNELKNDRGLYIGQKLKIKRKG
ncbi:lytic transglycosylase domain-containing protein [Draconibacterium halophilum]|uniref:LysM peptidoglycan-binding domain-containing protein n=1 Tax=Draconibacterium halophilum TaxID=2706887 RepID=A0A6C0RI66_9BACT|nr:lytic transglycosylase domain-containing protein [Draconibacterium halophilum]QIA09767.1 LysM peptidoglycan-binding domain-containing protein [Draconibacterium halophilum]